MKVHGLPKEHICLGRGAPRVLRRGKNGKTSPHILWTSCPERQVSGEGYHARAGKRGRLSEITVQQLMAHLDSIRKDMVILEKSEFANLRAENEKMKTELDQVKQQLINETSRIRADNKLDINLERSRVTDMFTDQQKKLMEVTTEFTKKDNQTKSVISETSNKIDTEIASLKTLMESNKLDTIRYLAASVFTCLAIALGFYRIWK
ncbi:coiled-coil domain-containing protein 90B, mitochondrial isoform X2 [Tenrec ecaudatus]|uniref:coiled-coil domain-containing protein 90B, mitochondrial isoform X2 n=1 Tax=Tenrec ecaudatus TaxID=94439 RepID=UPI003F599C8C